VQIPSLAALSNSASSTAMFHAPAAGSSIINRKENMTKNPNDKPECRINDDVRTTKFETRVRPNQFFFRISSF